MLHQILTGRLRHEGKSVYSRIIRAHLSEPYDYGPEVPVELARAANRAMARALRALERRGWVRSSCETAAELGERARAAGDVGAGAFLSLVELHYAQRFGDRPVEQSEMERLAQEVERPPDSGV